jgi:hypothetical protein
MDVSKPGKTVYLEVGIWYNEDQDNIHITAKDFGGFHSTVNGNPASVRGHPNLFNKLAACLREAGVPAPQPVRAGQQETD